MSSTKTHKNTISDHSNFVEIESSRSDSPASNLHEAIKRNIHPAGFTLKQISYNEKISPQFLLNACNKNLPRIKLPLTRAISIMKFTGDYSILHHMNKDLGWFAFKVPLTTNPSPEKLLPFVFKFKAEYEKFCKLLDSFYSEGSEKKELLRQIEEKLFSIVNTAAAVRVVIFKNIKGSK